MSLSTHLREPDPDRPLSRGPSERVARGTYSTVSAPPVGGRDTLLRTLRRRPSPETQTQFYAKPGRAVKGDGWDLLENLDPVHRPCPAGRRARDDVEWYRIGLFPVKLVTAGAAQARPPECLGDPSCA
jgi:hypothetical protein